MLLKYKADHIILLLKTLQYLPMIVRIKFIFTMVYKTLQVWAPGCLADLLPTIQASCGPATLVSVKVADLFKGLYLCCLFFLSGMLCPRCSCGITVSAIQVSIQKLLFQRGTPFSSMLTESFCCCLSHYPALYIFIAMYMTIWPILIGLMSISYVSSMKKT